VTKARDAEVEVVAFPSNVSLASAGRLTVMVAVYPAGGMAGFVHPAGGIAGFV
jgi:hypothetical protein